MKTLYQVDAFTQQLFKGNSAGVMILQEFLPDNIMQNIAMENNLAETAFAVPRAEANGEYDIRYFTPSTEVDLCGHATLATVHIIFDALGMSTNEVTFQCQVGALICKKLAHGQYQIDLPAANNHQSTDEYFNVIKAATGQQPKEVWLDTFMLAVFDDPKVVIEMEADLGLIEQFDYKGDLGCLLVTAANNDQTGLAADFVSRYFAPGIDIPEDPVTGAAHCMLAPYWAQQLGKDQLVGYQASPRGGYVSCDVQEQRVLLTGHAVTYMKAELFI